MENFEQRSTNTVAPIAIDFSSYSDLQYDNKGNNIPNIIARLLQMYQPDDGITAYENVLKKIQKLLEDCDFQKKQLLLSMIPTPNNVPDHTVKEVFHSITGFIKLNLQENNKIFQSTLFDIKDMDGILDNNVSSSKQSFSYDKNASNFKSSFSETFPFRGFPESEISTIQSNVINADSSNHQLDNNLKNCLGRNNKYQISPYRHLLNKKYCVPTRINTTSEPHFYFPSQTVHQDTCSMKAYNNIEIIADLCQDKNLRQFNGIKYGYTKKCQDKRCHTFVKDKKSGVSHMIIDIGQNATMKQTIKDNIHKMDVCWDEDQNIVVDADDLLATARDKLKTSLNNFLKRAQEGTSIELPVFPRIRSYPMGSSNLAYLTSKDEKPGMPHKGLGQDFTSNVSSSDSNNCLLSKQNTDVNLGKDQRKSDGRTEQKTFTCINGLQTQCSSEGFNKVTELQLQPNNLDYIMEKKAVKLEYKENDTDESIFGHKMAGSKSNDVNSEDNFQVHSMSQLAAYKKQYYDTLLSVQRAKAAVTNSLASSSDHLTSYDDPYYSNYMCQQQHLFRQQHHFTARPQFSTYPDLSGLSNVHSNQYSWARSVCKYLLLKQLRLQRQTSPLYARNQDGWIHRYIGPAYSFMPNESDQTKHCVRRKSLEDIIGKLKGIERSNVNN